MRQENITSVHNVMVDPLPLKRKGKGENERKRETAGLCLC